MLEINFPDEGLSGSRKSIDPFHEKGYAGLGEGELPNTCFNIVTKFL